MNRLTALVGTIAVATTLAAPAAASTISPKAPPPTEGSRYVCHLKERTDSFDRRVSGYAYDHIFYIHITQKFLVCKRAGHHTYSLPVATVARYNRDGSHQFCSKWNPILTFSHMRANSYYVDRYGHHFNPPEFRVPCGKDTDVTRTQYYNDPPRLYWANGHAPSWVTWVGLEFRGDWTPHPHGNARGVLHGV